MMVILGVKGTDWDAAGIVHAIDEALLVVLTIVDLDVRRQGIELFVNFHDLSLLNIE